MELEMVVCILQLLFIGLGLTIAIGVSVLITLDHRAFDRYWNDIVKKKKGVSNGK